MSAEKLLFPLRRSARVFSVLCEEGQSKHVRSHSELAGVYWIAPFGPKQSWRSIKPRVICSSGPLQLCVALQWDFNEMLYCAQNLMTDSVTALANACIRFIQPPVKAVGILWPGNKTFCTLWVLPVSWCSFAWVISLVYVLSFFLVSTRMCGPAVILPHTYIFVWGWKKKNVSLTSWPHNSHSRTEEDFLGKIQ